MWELKIEKIENGFILSHKEEIEENNVVLVKEVLEEDDNGEKETMTRLLERVSDYFGVKNNKFAEDNLKITWDKKGHKID